MNSYAPFSKKQLRALTWWMPPGGDCARDAVICDGAVRSGKTLCMSLSFVSWSFWRHRGQSFAICGKTVTSLRRNVIRPLTEQLSPLGFKIREMISKNYMDISFHGVTNRFYLFGGKDESSAALIQGITLAGVMFDEVALMPRSFVEQAIARCSVEGSTFWFNCNPAHPAHWFYTEWIQKAPEKNALYLHFRMEDNPSLSKAMLSRYRRMYSGVFYERFVLGKWVQAQGLVYPMFSADAHVVDFVPECGRFYISCDYGTVNPSSFGLWGEHQGRWYRLREYYHCSRTTGVIKTDQEHYDALEELAGDKRIEAVIVDPSAASFIELIRRRGRFSVIPAKNNVLDGIRRVADALRSGEILLHRSCADSIREFSLYVWEPSSIRDAPLKQNDHAMDDIRYFAATALDSGAPEFFALSALRQAERKGGDLRLGAV